MGVVGTGAPEVPCSFPQGGHAMLNSPTPRLLRAAASLAGVLGRRGSRRERVKVDLAMLTGDDLDLTLDDHKRPPQPPELQVKYRSSST